ncbi:MAG: sugar phosphate isomerase/epimerase family protein [Kiritimatiellia bacterium]
MAEAVLKGGSGGAGLGRRAFLSSAFALGAAAAVRPAAAAGPARRIRIGVQMYSLRDLMLSRMGAAFAGVRSLGIEGVELWNMQTFDPKGVRSLLDANGLVACGNHVPLDLLRPARISETIDRTLTAGAKLLIVPWLDPRDEQLDPAQAGDWWLEKADAMNAAAETLARAGCRLGYHTHSHEFADRIGGKPVWEILMARWTPAIRTQYDFCMVARGGGDAIAWMRRAPGRTESVHFRDEYDYHVGFYGAIGCPPPGSKGLDWPAIYGAVREDAVEWAIVEPTSSGSFDTIYASLEAMRRDGFIIRREAGG